MTYRAEHGAPQTQRSLWDKIWRNAEGDVVVFQWPNIWLIVWAAANFVSIVSPTRGLSKTMWWIGTAMLIIWAALEILQGVNYFRRVLGSVVMLFSIASVLGAGF